MSNSVLTFRVNLMVSSHRSPYCFSNAVRTFHSREPYKVQKNLFKNSAEIQKGTFPEVELQLNYQSTLENGLKETLLSLICFPFEVSFTICP